MRTHDISKLKFVDFEEMTFVIELGFSPFEIQICENYVAAVGRDTMHLFRILVGNDAEGQSEMKREGTMQDFSFLCEFFCLKTLIKFYYFFASFLKTPKMNQLTSKN